MKITNNLLSSLRQKEYGKYSPKLNILMLGMVACTSGVCDKDHIHAFPAASELMDLANQVMQQIASVNTDIMFVKETRMDTVCVARCRDGLVVAGNVKERRLVQPDHVEESVSADIRIGKRSRRAKMAYVNFGLTLPLSNLIMNVVRGSHLYARYPTSIWVVEEKHNPLYNPELNTMVEKAKKHAEKHAEVKLIAFCDAPGLELLSIGITKSACPRCHDKLKEAQVMAMSPQVPGITNVKNWKENLWSRLIMYVLMTLALNATGPSDLPSSSGRTWQGC